MKYRGKNSSHKYPLLKIKVNEGSSVSLRGLRPFSYALPHKYDMCSCSLHKGHILMCYPQGMCPHVLSTRDMCSCALHKGHVLMCCPQGTSGYNPKPTYPLLDKCPHRSTKISSRRSTIWRMYVTHGTPMWTSRGYSL
jgi:hypothetical protein